MSVTHIAAQPVELGPLLRQRCAWCGAVLLDVDLRRIAVQITSEHPEPEPYPTWPVGELVAVDGGARWVVEHAEGAPVPDDCCAALDPSVTA